MSLERGERIASAVNPNQQLVDSGLHLLQFGHEPGGAFRVREVFDAEHPAFDADVETARASIRKLAALNPSAAWAGHADPVTGDVSGQLEQAAAAPV